MDISQETDTTKLKALCYDQLKVLNQTQVNIQALEQRIADLAEVSQDTLKKK